MLGYHYELLDISQQPWGFELPFRLSLLFHVQQNGRQGSRSQKLRLPKLTLVLPGSAPQLAWSHPGVNRHRCAK